MLTKVKTLSGKKFESYPMKLKITTSSTGPIEASFSDENPLTTKVVYEALPILEELTYGVTKYTSAYQSRQTLKTEKQL